jgi:hypothetical protein
MTNCRDKRIGRRHHKLCSVIKHSDPRPACAEYLGQECDPCLIGVDNEEVVEFESMASIVQPECKEHSAMVRQLDFLKPSLCCFVVALILPQSAFDLATSYPDLGKKLFPEGACHPQVCACFCCCK